MYIEPMPYLTNVGKRMALSKEPDSPMPVGKAQAANDDTNDHVPQHQKLRKKQPRTHNLINEQNNSEEEVIHCNLSTEDFLELLSC